MDNDMTQPTTPQAAPAQHTPGPWYDDGYRIHAPTSDPDKRNGRVIVDYKHMDGFVEADADLIASAPDLLAERDRLKATNAELRALLECICYWHYGPEGEGANERFERIADSFRRDTGMLRPGKDQPGAMGGSPSDEDRAKAFRKWCDDHHEELATATRAALAAAKGVKS